MRKFRFGGEGGGTECVLIDFVLEQQNTLAGGTLVHLNIGCDPPKCWSSICCIKCLFPLLVLKDIYNFFVFCLFAHSQMGVLVSPSNHINWLSTFARKDRTP